MSPVEKEENITKLRRKVKKRNERSTILLQAMVTFSASMYVEFLNVERSW